MQRLLGLLVERASTQPGCAQDQRSVTKSCITESVTKRKERHIFLVHVARMVFFVAVGRWTTEINTISRTAGIQCIIVEGFLAHAARHRNGKLPARPHIAKNCSYGRRSILPS